MEAEYNECCNKIKEKEMKQDMWMKGIEQDLSDVICRVDKLEIGECCKDSALQEENKRLLQLRKELEAEIVKCQLNSACGQHYNDLQNEINDLSCRCSRLSTDKNILSEENQRLTKALEEVKRLYSGNAERKLAMREHAELREKVEELINQNDRLLTAREANINQIDNLEQKIKEIESETEMLKANYRFAKDHIEKLETQKYYSGYGFNNYFPRY